MENTLEKAYAEVNKILSYMDEKEVEKIPNKLRNTFENEKLKDYEPNINPEVSLLEQNLQRKTFVILAILTLNYWCESEEEKKELVRRYSDYDKKIEDELREKYNPDNIFKNKEENNKIEEVTEEKKEEVALVEYEKQSFFRKIVNKITKFFKNK